MTVLRRMGAVAVVLVANGYALAHGSANRAGEPDAVVRMTERELPSAWVSQENTGRSLRLVWQGNLWWGDGSATWFDHAKLESLGFDLSIPSGDSGAAHAYRRMLARPAYIVLEFDGASWREWLARERARADSLAAQQQQQQQQHQPPAPGPDWATRQERTASRLVAIDVGPDPLRLREHYPDRGRFIIAPGLVEVRYYSTGIGLGAAGQQARFTGYVSRIFGTEITVPRAHRAVLDSLERHAGDVAPEFSSEGGPRYAVTLVYGRKHEPWIAEIAPLAPSAATEPDSVAP